MDNKITFPELASAVAAAAGVSKSVCEEFLRELFAVISEQLEAGENVKIKRIGTFKSQLVEPRKSVDVQTGREIEIPGHRKVSFTPAKELAEAVNMPFAAFETVELTDGVTEEMLDQAAGETVVEQPITEPEPTPEVKPVPQEVTPVPEETQWVEESAPEPMPEPQTSPELDLPREEKRLSFGVGFVVGLFTALIVLMAGFAIWWFALRGSSVEHRSNTPDADTVASVTSAAEPIDTVEKTIAQDIVPTQPSDAVVMDTISTTRYLTTMAKEHYGNYHLWPFIYEENKAKLGHPDRIKPGTPVVIPSAAKYGIDASNPDCVARARKMGVEIYAKYENK